MHRSWRYVRLALSLQPLTDDGNGFARILVGKVADLLHRLGVNLALDLGDVDHLGGLARLRASPPRFPSAAAVAGAAGASARRRRRAMLRMRALVRREDAAHQRPHHQQQDDEAEQAHDHHFDGAHDVVLGELQRGRASRSAR